MGFSIPSCKTYCLFNKWYWNNNWTFVSKKKSRDTDLTPDPKIISRWTIDLNVKHKTIKFPGNDLGENLGDFVFGNEFLETTLQKHSQWERKISWSLWKLRMSVLRKTLLREWEDKMQTKRKCLQKMNLFFFFFFGGGTQIERHIFEGLVPKL